MAALAGVTTYMGISLLDIGTWRRLRQMHFIDAASFLITVVGVLVSNAVTAVIAGAGIYVLRYVYKRYLHPMSFEAGAADRAA
jgi:MFS superfamily sulfate permease-like transporter